jgi:xanthine dehydrogenase YagS FAD-binding subunit
MLFELPPFEHVDATSTAEAVRLLAGHVTANGSRAAIIAGATDMLGLLKDSVRGPALPIPEVLVNIKPIEELKLINADEGCFTIGAAVTLARLSEDALIRARLPALAEAASAVGTTQLRNMGTVGGNLCQRPRCMYFRHPDFPCFRKGGRKCFAVSGEHRDYHAIIGAGKCVMAHPSDTAPVLVALGAEVVIAGRAGVRRIPLQKLFAGPNASCETTLGADELLVRIQVPFPGQGNRQIFLKHRVRHAADFALASVAVSAESVDGLLHDVRLVIGGVAPVPLVATGAQDFVRGKRPGQKLFAEAADSALEGARPLAHNGFKLDLVRTLIRRALAAVTGESP